MTQVRMGLYQPTETGEDVLVEGAVDWVPSRRRVTDDGVVLPAPFRVRLDGVEAPVVEVAPTPSDGLWAWVVTERATGGAAKRGVQVPVSSGVVEYSALVEVDTATLDPVGPPPVDVWVQALEGATSAATTTALGAASSAALAADAAADAKGEAEQARDAAEGHAGTATTQAGLAEGARDGAVAAQGLAEGARDAAIAAAGGITTWWTGTQAEYDALTPDEDTLYVVVED